MHIYYYKVKINFKGSKLIAVTKILMFDKITCLHACKRAPTHTYL